MDRRNALIERQLITRKRKRNEHLWKRNRIKLARESGSAYISNSKLPVAAKKPNLSGPLCLASCRKNCSSKLSLEQREAAFSAYYSLDWVGKNYLLSNCLTRKEVRCHRKDIQKPKQNTFVYRIKVPDQFEPVALCKKALCSLFQITAKRLETIQKRHLTGETIELSDRRGKTRCPNRNKTPEHVMNEVFKHFESFKTEIAAHSIGNSEKRKNNPPRFTIKQMYDHYIEECKSNGLPTEYFIKYALYAHHFGKQSQRSA